MHLSSDVLSSSAPLAMDLRSLLPELPSELLLTLENVPLETPSDLLFHSGITPGIRPTIIYNVQKHISRTLAAPGRRGDYEYLDKEETLRKRDSSLYTGATKLDDLLSGLGGPGVLEFAGSKSSGKSVSQLPGLSLAGQSSEDAFSRQYCFMSRCIT